MKTKSENSTYICLWLTASVYQRKLNSTNKYKAYYKIQCTTIYLQCRFKTLLLNSKC